MGHYTVVGFTIPLKADTPPAILEIFQTVIETAGEIGSLHGKWVWNPGWPSWEKVHETTNKLLGTSWETRKHQRSSGNKGSQSRASTPAWNKRSFKQQSDGTWLFKSYSSVKFEHRELAVRLLKALIPFLASKPGDILYRSLYDWSPSERVIWYDYAFDEMRVATGYMYEPPAGSKDVEDNPNHPHWCDEQTDEGAGEPFEAPGNIVLIEAHNKQVMRRFPGHAAHQYDETIE